MNKTLRKEDLVKLVKGLDITPTMFKNATEKYENLGHYLQEVGLEVDIFPQGSFSIGTIVRPYRNLQDGSYDLDFICRVNKQKENTNAKTIKYDVYKALCKNETYKKLLCKEEYDKCWTLEYAEIDGIDFNMDIVPAVREDNDTILYLQSKGINITMANKAVAITNRKKGVYKWSTSNPKAYREWFEVINAPFIEYNRQTKLEKMISESRGFYNSIESIPIGMERSALQRVIQLLKRHRDVYFSKNKRERDKPLSAVITTISALIARNASPSLDVYDLLQFIVHEFEVYSNIQRMNESEFNEVYKEKKVIERQNGKWIIMNPVNPKDNLADAWNEEPEKAVCFFQWVKQIKKDFIDSLYEQDDKFISALENGLGSNYVQKNINKNNYNFLKPQLIINTPKHWRSHCDK
ncbi:nucleotidyltransferase domain-containing protein [Clostridium oryzae]|uniref:Nucleotidyltransferase n=1 Tax=Clostridium oryzae TaxID=1450648 RepID=A0A1V4I6W3_9CLOT|nr:nucleotidyltransferase [Clostridium oryzae]OPJ55706.1 hypothetical protein CLORY_43770 [Clostridium oryzae]